MPRELSASGPVPLRPPSLTSGSTMQQLQATNRYRRKEAATILKLPRLESLCGSEMRPWEPIRL